MQGEWRAVSEVCVECVDAPPKRDAALRKDGQSRVVQAVINEQQLETPLKTTLIFLGGEDIRMSICVVSFSKRLVKRVY